MIYVVGSGPSGIACARELLQKGLCVTMLDAGIALEKDKQEALAQLSKSDKWDASLLTKLRGKLDAFAKDGPLKLSYGSDYSYKDVKKHIPMSEKGIICRPSFAKGGLSTVWGASVMPYLDEDMVGWPFRTNILAAHYKKVLSFMNVAGFDDDLAKLFPLYSKMDNYKHSSQASQLLKKFEKNRASLHKKGFIFGSSRLAIRFKGKAGCSYCGLCMYGCPLQLIYCSASTLETLQKNKNFTYIPNIVVDKVDETSEKVLIRAHKRNSGEKIDFAGSRVFLACGTVPSTKVVLASIASFDKEIFLKDSQHFTIPCLMFKGSSKVTQEHLHTSCQAYIELFDKKIDPHSVHLQIYTYLDMYENALKKLFGPLYKLLKIPLGLVLARIIVIKGYLHSNSSSKIRMVLKQGNPDRVDLHAVVNNSTKGIVKKLVRTLLRNSLRLGFFPLFLKAKLSKPGASNHYGSSFPMSKNPKGCESDLLGRPFGLKRIHVVDSSVFPSIPSQSITFTVMANSSRIANETADIIMAEKSLAPKVELSVVN